MNAPSDGLSILIPERGRADLLFLSLTALRAALLQLDASCETIVLVNGAGRSDYAELETQFPEVDFRFERKPLGFGGAVERLAAAARHDWVYLLNSDMCLAPQALAAVWPWRDPKVFAVGSQIFFADATRRREETGWCVPVRNARNRIELHDRVPDLDQQVRGSIYAGGGSSLMQTALLRRFIRNTGAYAPFYFEDADWGMQAWACGYDVLFCPRSIAVHHHRATIAHFYGAAQIARIVDRNLNLWRLRYAECFQPSRLRRKILDAICAPIDFLRPSTRRVRKLLRDQLACAPDWPGIPEKRYLHASRWRAGKLRALVVSPFSVLPPAHGGARRILELCRATADDIDWVLLNDEGASSQPVAPEDLAVFRQWHSVRGRPEDGPSPMTRIAAHAHPAFKAELARLLANCQPQLVCLEHYESLGLLDVIPEHFPVVLSLHDGGSQLTGEVKRWVRQHTRRVIAIAVPAVLDLDEFARPKGQLIANGVRIPEAHSASSASGPLLFVAPMRYAANRRALADFMRLCWAQLCAARPSLRLRILAGEAGMAYCRELVLSADARVEVVAEYVDPVPHYSECCLAINPQTGIEGSSLKLIEALGHRRMVISTLDGARGFDAIESAALVRVGDVAGMTEPILKFLADTDARHRAEAAGPTAAQPWRWDAIGEQWLRLLRQSVR
jgi:GT2 family glycosyltransferase